MHNTDQIFPESSARRAVHACIPAVPPGPHHLVGAPVFPRDGEEFSDEF